jgi:hydrogenase maturation protein HypF
MLPYTPLHHLLFAALAPLGISALVMTSGNASDEPICLDNAEARRDLQGIADHWLLHDRDIVRRADDSVVQLLADGPLYLRRSRGYAPVPVAVRDLPAGPPVLAVGPELKNTVCLLKENRAFLSPHIGDLANLKAYEFFQETVATLQQVLECAPAIIAHDLHPDYLSTRWAREQAADGLQLVPVQHHHAHLVAVQAEHGLMGPTLGLILDGTGYGTDGTIWGGEILAGDAHRFERLGHFQPIPLPGGDAAIKAPWRVVVSQFRTVFGTDPAAWPRLPVLAGRPVAQILAMLERGINSPLTSSCGRLFDAVAALTGGWAEVHYEAQAAIELMALTTREATAAASPFAGVSPPCTTDNQTLVLPTGSIITAVVQALAAGATPPQISARFHRTLSDLLTAAMVIASERTNLQDVVLAGGVFQNEILLGDLTASLQAAGLRPWRPLQTPPNDGQVALGQAVIARCLTTSG